MCQADAIHGQRYAVEIAPLSPETTSRLAEVLGHRQLAGLVEPRNPLDLTPMADEQVYEQAVRALLEADEVEAVVVGIVPLTSALKTTAVELEAPDSLARRLPTLFARTDKPLAAVIDSGSLCDPLARALRLGGVPVLRSADQAIRSLGRYQTRKPLRDAKIFESSSSEHAAPAPATCLLPFFFCERVARFCRKEAMARIGLLAASLVLIVFFVGCGASQGPAPQTVPAAKAPDPRAVRAQHDQAFAERAALLRERCGITAEVRIDWPTIDAAAQQQHDVSARCGVLLEGMGKLCAAKIAPRSFATVKQISCGFDDESSLVLDAGILNALIAPGQADLADALEQRLKSLEEGKAPSLAAAKGDVCYKDEKHVILLFPQGTEHHGLSYGDGTSFFYLGQPRGLGVGWFFEPRYPSKRRVFRGYNLEVFSKVSVDHEQRTCTLRCGDRVIPLSLANHEESAKILAGATFKAPPHQRKVHALARDMRGIYYLVDRGTTKATRADFRVYIGRRNNLKLQEMKDIAADSEGEIFSTKGGKYKLVFGRGSVYTSRREPLKPQEIMDAVVDSEGELFVTRRGKLYLVVGEGQSAWIVNKKTRKLQVLPVEENLPMIFNELGVYPRHGLGTPCDDI